MTPLTALLTGLTTGGLTCMAVQGGLLFGVLARQEEDHPSGRHWSRLLLPVAAFLIAKITAYTILGLGLGWLGNKVALTTTAKLWLQTFASLFMIVAGIRLIVPHWLPWLSFNPPASVRRLVRRSAKSQMLVAPAVLGLLTILIPCGTTQAMEVAAIATGRAAQAAGIMFGFTLGTAPLFLLVGVLAKGTTIFQSRLRYAAAALVVGLGLFSFNSVLTSLDSPYSVQNEARAFRTAFGANGGEPSGTAADTMAEINVMGNGYSPNEVTVKAGTPVSLALKTKGGLGCTSVFRIPKLNIEQNLPQEGTTLVTATFEPGQYTFTCGMGMFRGTITAV